MYDRDTGKVRYFEADVFPLHVKCADTCEGSHLNSKTRGRVGEEKKRGKEKSSSVAKNFDYFACISTVLVIYLVKTFRYELQICQSPICYSSLLSFKSLHFRKFDVLLQFLAPLCRNISS